MLTSADRKTPGMATNRNRRCGTKRGPAARRLGRLEEKLINEPTFLVMADGHVEIIEGPKDHLLTLFSVAVTLRLRSRQQTWS